MDNKKVISSFVIFFLVCAIIFSFFYFSYDEVIKKQIVKLIPTSFPDNFKPVNNNGNGVVSISNTSGVLTIKGIIEETNRHRGTYNLPPLQEDFGLNEVARIKLDKMFEEQYFAHVSPGGVGVSDIADSVGYKYLLIGDNLARGDYSSDRDVVGAWMDSHGHRRNVLEERYERIGVAARKDDYKGREEWIAVQIFSMPSSACPEIDDNLLIQIEERKGELQDIEDRRREIQREIDSVPRGSEEHIAKVEEFNSNLILYNEKVRELDVMINDYNNQIRIREECIKN